MVRPFFGLLIGVVIPLGASAQTGGDSAVAGKLAARCRRDSGGSLCDLSRTRPEEGGP